MDSIAKNLHSLTPAKGSTEIGSVGILGHINCVHGEKVKTTPRDHSFKDFILRIPDNLIIVK